MSNPAAEYSDEVTALLAADEALKQALAGCDVLAIAIRATALERCCEALAVTATAIVEAAGVPL